MLEKISSPEHTLEQLHSGELLYLPDLTDPNVQGITPGLINTHLFFAEFTPPEQVVNSFVRLKERLFLNPLLKPAEVLLQSALYQDYLKLTIFLFFGCLNSKFCACKNNRLHHKRSKFKIFLGAYMESETTG